MKKFLIHLSRLTFASILLIGGAQVSSAQAVVSDTSFAPRDFGAFPALATPQTQAWFKIADSGSATIRQANPSSTIDYSVFGPTGNAQGLLDMTTGLLRAQSSGSFGFSNSISGWDFLQFDGNGTVSWAFNVDGSFSNWTSYFGFTDGIQLSLRNGIFSPYADTLADIVASSFERVGVRSSAATSCAAIGVSGLCATSSNGDLVPVEFSLTGSAAVQSDRLYLIELTMNLSTLNGAGNNGLQTANFADTAAFVFTDLDGLSFNSASGQFLAAVPEPQTWALWAAGLLLAVTVARQRRPE
jgi:hypothetical protein